MGYDMYAERPAPETETQAVEAAREKFNQAVKERDSLPKEEQGEFNIDRVRNEQLPFGDHAAFDGRSERYKAAQDAVDAASDAMRAADKSYFRLNIFGMGRYAEAMHALGMLQNIPSPGPWPEKPEHLDWEEIPELAGDREDDQDPEDAGKPVKPEALEYARAMEAYLSWTPEEVTGLAAFKFGSNDGWHVTPVEIAAAVRAYRLRTGQEVRAALGAAGITDIGYWTQWIEFLVACEFRGGFRVH